MEVRIENNPHSCSSVIGQIFHSRGALPGTDWSRKARARISSLEIHVKRGTLRGFQAQTKPCPALAEHENLTRTLTTLHKQTACPTLSLTKQTHDGCRGGAMGTGMTTRHGIVATDHSTASRQGWQIDKSLPRNGLWACMCMATATENLLGWMGQGRSSRPHPSLWPIHRAEFASIAQPFGGMQGLLRIAITPIIVMAEESVCTKLCDCTLCSSTRF